MQFNTEVNQTLFKRLLLAWAAVGVEVSSAGSQKRVPALSVWVLPEHSGFLPQFKHMHVGLTPRLTQFKLLYNLKSNVNPNQEVTKVF